MPTADPAGQLSAQILADMFGPRVAAVGGDLAGRGTKTLGQLAAGSGLGLGQVRTAVAVLLQHGLVTASQARKPPVVDYTIQPERVMAVLQLPAFLHLVRGAHGELAEALVLQVARAGAGTASSVLLHTARELQEGGDAPSIPTLYKQFKLLVSLDILQRCPPLLAPPPAPGGAEPEAPPPAPEPALGALTAALEGGGAPGEEPDRAVTWRVDTSTVAAVVRDSAIVKAAARRLDEAAGQVVSSILGLVSQGSQAWAAVSTHLGHHAIVERVAKDHGKEGTAYRHLDQYLRLLADERLVDRVGDAGGGQYSVDMEHVARRLAESSLDCTVLERFGSKALRIFRYVREKKYVEESTLQAIVMIPGKETKMLTYQLLETHFLHLQELKKTLASNAPSKAFYLYYVNLDQVVRTCVSLCHKAMYNLGRRAAVERADQARLLEKQTGLDSMVARLRAEGGTEEQLADLESLMTGPEREAVARVHRQLDKLASARQQAAETLHLLETHLCYRRAS